MKILVISDTHGDTGIVQSLLERYTGTVQAVLHLGDHDYDLMQFADTTHLFLAAVPGNCDPIRAQRERILKLGGRRILMTHGNRLVINSDATRLILFAREKRADICLFGHTHVSAVFTDGDILFVNPGSIAEPRDGKPPCFALLTLGDTVAAEIVYP